MKPIRLSVIVAFLVSSSLAQASFPTRVMHYYPEGRDIVCVNGESRYNRALYGGYTEFRLETSDRPIFATYRSKAHKNIRFRLISGGQSLPLEQTAFAEARYHAGKRVYLLSDPAWGRGALTLTVLAQPDTESAIWKFEPHGMPADASVEMVVCDILHPNFNRSGDMNSDPADTR